MLQLNQRPKHLPGTVVIKVGNEGLDDMISLIGRSYLDHHLGIALKHGSRRMILGIKKHSQGIRCVSLDSEVWFDEQEGDERIGERRSTFLDGSGNVSSNHDGVMINHGQDHIGTGDSSGGIFFRQGICKNGQEPVVNEVVVQTGPYRSLKVFGNGTALLNEAYGILAFAGIDIRALDNAKEVVEKGVIALQVSHNVDLVEEDE